MARGRLHLVIAVAATIACLLLLSPAAQAAPAAHLRSSHDENKEAASTGGIRKLTAAEVHELIQARRAAPAYHIAQEQDKRLALEREARGAAGTNGWFKPSVQDLKAFAAGRARGSAAKIEQEQANRLLLQRRARTSATMLRRDRSAAAEDDNE